MLAEIFLLRLEAMARSAQLATVVTTSPRFVPITLPHAPTASGQK